MLSACFCAASFLYIDVAGVYKYKYPYVCTSIDTTAYTLKRYRDTKWWVLLFNSLFQGVRQHPE